jgi:HSP20 family protein
MTTPVRYQNTELARRDPSSDLDSMFSQLTRFLDGWREVPSFVAEGFIPRADVEETDDAYLVELELPGVKKSDVDVSLEGRRLIVSGERKEKERVGMLRRRTRSVGRFHYDVVLPGEIDADGVTASLEDGVLTVRVPKSAAQQQRRIQVR